MKITHEEQCKAADWAGSMDYDPKYKYAEERKIQLSLGVHRAFEWLEDNGYIVTKKE